MKPIKRLSFKRFCKLLTSDNFKFGDSTFLYHYKYQIIRKGNSYEFYKNNGSFMEYFFNIEKKDTQFLVKSDYFSKLDPTKRIQPAYKKYHEEFKETIDLLTIKKKVDQYMPVEVSWVTEDFNELIIEFICFLNEGGSIS